MGLEQVIGEVQSGGERRAQAILDAARADADQLIAAARQKAADYQADRLAHAARDAEQVRAQALSRAQSDARKQVLTAEAELRAQLRGHLEAGLAGLDAATRKRHIAAFLAQAKAVIPDGRVWCAEADKAAAQKGVYELAGTRDMAGGIVVESKDGKVRLDLRYETLLDARWRDILRAESGLFS